MPIVDSAVYVDGRRTEAPGRAHPGADGDGTGDRHGFSWVGLYRPSIQEVLGVAKEFGLHPLAVEDTLHGHQRPKIERYGDVRFVVLRPARYKDEEEEVDFGEVNLFLGPDFAVVIRHAESPDLAAVRRRLESQPTLLARGPLAVLYAVADQVVDEYQPVVRGLENDIDEIEDQLFGGNPPRVAQRIYELSREVMMFQRAIAPLPGVLTTVRDEIGDDESLLEVRRGLRDVLDHVHSILTRVEAFRVLLQNALTVNATLVAQAQNDQTRELTEASYRQGQDVKKVSSWAAIGFAPSLVAGIYGMNFRFMPELDWRLGYPFALLLMIGVCAGLYALFRRNGWL